MSRSSVNHRNHRGRKKGPSAKPPKAKKYRGDAPHMPLPSARKHGKGARAQ